MAQNKTGFLTGAAGLNGNKNEVVYYQCKSCLSFLASTSKWDRHLSKCFSNSVGDRTLPRPVGFRMVTFTEPHLSLERIAHGQTDPAAENTFSPLAETIVPKKRGRGRPRKIIPSKNRVEKKDKPSVEHKTVPVEKTSQEDKLVRKRGRPRKVEAPTSINENETSPSLESTEDDNIIRKSQRPKKERNYLEVSIDEKRFKYVKSKKKAFIKGGLNIKRGRGRPRKIIEPEKVIIPKVKKSAKKGFFKAARRRQHVVNEKEDEVRRYKHSCPHCPGKFHIDRDLRIHVNSVHNGNRKVMECIVCGRIFNKRDSLNQHYCSHEAAEAREETFNLFQPWDDDLLEKVRSYRKNYSANFNRQQTCKACLLHHYSHHSFCTHFMTEHANPPESYTLTCKFGNCQQQFKSIRVFLEHAKTSHSEKFYGKLTLFRQERGFYIGNRVRYVPSSGHKQQRIPVKSKKKKPAAPSFEKRVSSFTPLERNDNDCSDWEEECGFTQRELARNEVDDESGIEDEEMTQLTRNIEVGCVDLHESAVKKEATARFSVENIKPENSHEIIIPDTIEDNGFGSLFPVESVPVPFGVVKGEGDMLLGLD